MIDFLKGTVGKDYFSDRLYGCQECIAEYLASKEPLSQPTNQSFTNRFIESRIIWIGSTAGMYTKPGIVSTCYRLIELRILTTVIICILLVWKVLQELILLL